MTKQYKVVYLGAESGLQAAQAVLSPIADVVHCPAEPADLEREIADADGILDASMRVRITAGMIGSSLRLRMISCATTGSDHIDRGALEARDIGLATLKGERELLNNITPAAELSWALLMATARRLVPAIEHVRAGKWVREEFPGIMLNGKQLGLVGCGRIGQWMARYAAAFGMTVVGHDPYLETFPNTIRQVPLEEVFADSDFVSIHVHLNEETTNLVSAELLANARKGMILINTARGAVVDQDALLEGLVSGHIAAAGLDVLTGEPDIEGHPLLAYAQTHDNLLITPHCGGFSPDAVRVVCAHAARKIEQRLTGKA